MNFAAYSKLIGTIIGGAVGIFVSWLATISPLASCVPPEAAEGVIQACSVLGLSTEQVTTSLTLLFASIGTWKAPPNQA